MPSRHVALLLLVLLGAVAATAWLLLGEEGLSTGGLLSRDGPAGGAAGGVIDLESARLQGQPGARRPEEVEAERARAEAAAQPAFPRSAGVFGRVTDAGGTGIEGATIKLTAQPMVQQRWGLPDPEPLATALTGADGTFLVGPAPEGRLRVRAEAEGYAPTVEPVKLRGYRVDLILDRGGSLEVLVKSPDGQGVPEARVLYQVGDVVTDRLTDAEGLAVFPGLPTGDGSIFVSAKAFAAVLVPNVGVLPGRTDRRTVVLGKPLVVEGRVVDEDGDRPIESARVTFHFTGMPWMDDVGPVATDADGRLETEIPLPLQQAMEVEVQAEGYAPSRTWFQASDAGAGRMTVEVKLMRGGGGIRGEVVDHRGRPLGGVRVAYVPEREGQDAPETTSASDGRFSLPAVPWANRRGSRAQIAAISELAGVGSAWVAMPKEGETPQPVRIQLSGTGAVQGKVVDAAQVPVEGALVTLEVDWNATMKGAEGRIGPQGWATLSLAQDPRFVRPDAVTDAEGHFSIDGVPLAAYQVRASFGLDAVTLEEPVTLEPGVTASCEIVLGEGQTIEGYVRDSEGNPVAGAHVSGWAEGDRQRGPRQTVSARSQSDGRFVLHGVTADAYWLRAWAAGYQSERVRGIRRGSADVTLEMQTLGWIDGVVMHDGRPYQGTFTVLARATEAKEPRSGRGFMGQPGQQAATFNTDDGTFQLKNLEGGEYEVVAQTPDGLIAPEARRVRVTMGRGARTELSLVGGAVVSGTLVEDATGAPIANAQLNVRAVAGDDAPVSTANARTDAEGRFVLRGLQTGRYVIQVWPPSGIRIRYPLEVAAGESKTIRIREQAPGEVRVIVRDEAGRAVEGARPRIRSEGGDEEWPNFNVLRREGLDLSRGGWEKVIETDANGVNLRRYVPVGRYEVSADKQGFETVEAKWIEVASGRTAEVEIVLRAVAQPDR